MLDPSVIDCSWLAWSVQDPKKKYAQNGDWRNDTYLELKSLWIYQSYSEDILSNVNYQFENGTFYSNENWGPLGWSGQPKKGQVLLMGRTSQTKGPPSPPQAPCLPGLPELQSNPDCWRHWKMSVWLTSQAGKGSGDDWTTQNQTHHLWRMRSSGVAIARALCSEAPDKCGRYE